jgi:hypothetical protein
LILYILCNILYSQLLKCEEDIAASLKNGKTTDECGASDTESDSGDNGDDS